MYLVCDVLYTLELSIMTILRHFRAKPLANQNKVDDARRTTRVYSHVHNLEPHHERIWEREIHYVVVVVVVVVLDLESIIFAIRVHAHTRQKVRNVLSLVGNHSNNSESDSSSTHRQECCCCQRPGRFISIIIVTRRRLHGRWYVGWDGRGNGRRRIGRRAGRPKDQIVPIPRLFKIAKFGRIPTLVVGQFVPKEIYNVGSIEDGSPIVGIPTQGKEILLDAQRRTGQIGPVKVKVVVDEAVPGFGSKAKITDDLLTLDLVFVGDEFDGIASESVPSFLRVAQCVDFGQEVISQKSILYVAEGGINDSTRVHVLGLARNGIEEQDGGQKSKHHGGVSWFACLFGSWYGTKCVWWLSSKQNFKL
jgi:hypothetical protein